MTALIEGEEPPLGLPLCLWAQPGLLPPAHLAYPLRATACEPIVEIRQFTDQLSLPLCCSIESGIVQQLVLVTFAVPLDPGAGPLPPNLQACCYDTDDAKPRFRIFVAGGLLLTLMLAGICEDAAPCKKSNAWISAGHLPCICCFLVPILVHPLHLHPANPIICLLAPLLLHSLQRQTTLPSLKCLPSSFPLRSVLLHPAMPPHIRCLLQAVRCLSRWSRGHCRSTRSVCYQLMPGRLYLIISGASSTPCQQVYRSCQNQHELSLVPGEACRR